MKNKKETWIGSEMLGDLFKFRNIYVLSVFTFDGLGKLVYKGNKNYKYKQSAIRYIKNNF